MTQRSRADIAPHMSGAGRWWPAEGGRLGHHLSDHGFAGRTILNTVPVVPEGPRIFEAMT
jgi:hypothetical protein